MSRRDVIKTTIEGFAFIGLMVSVSGLLMVISAATGGL